jgi:hypothetical protein
MRNLSIFSFSVLRVSRGVLCLEGRSPATPCSFVILCFSALSLSLFGRKMPYDPTTLPYAMALSRLVRDMGSIVPAAGMVGAAPSREACSRLGALFAAFHDAPSGDATVVIFTELTNFDDIVTGLSIFNVHLAALRDLKKRAVLAFSAAPAKVQVLRSLISELIEDVLDVVQRAITQLMKVRG